MSADLRLHSVAFFLLPLLQHLAAEGIEAFCYSNRSRADEMTVLLRAASAGWCDIARLDDAAAADRVRRDGIDLLVDLSGHTAGNRLGLFALRPAPMQASWLGYPNTTGHPAIDWRIVDRLTDPPDPAVDALATERLLRLDRCFVCYRAPPVEHGLAVPTATRAPGDAPVFGSFNALAKLTPTTIALWARVLAAVPDASLTLKAEGTDQRSVQERLSAAFAAHGIEARRLHFLPREPSLAAHLARYGEVDVALDTWPYHGTTTTCEALAMGVPVVSLTGDRHASRVGASLLAAVGEPTWATDSSAAFVERATTLADEARAGRRDRDALRRQVLSSALCDAAAFARAFAEAIRGLC